MTCAIADFGAIGNGETDSAQAVQRAIATDRAVDSGRKLIPAASSGLFDASFESLRHYRQF